jgi:FMN phosphatase YigB (HAD superfamily)
VSPGEGPPHAVTFDYWETLVHADEANPMRELQISAFASVLAGAGHDRGREELVAAFAENWTHFDAAWSANAGQYTPADATDRIAALLHVPLDPGLRARLIGAFDEAGRVAALEVPPGAEGCLERLRRHGVRLAIVCDVGLTPSPVLRERLCGFGLLRWFDAWSFSDETGWFKPAPQAFLAALEPLGVPPGEAAHVGDMRRTDVAGARALGMRAIRFRGFSDDAGEGPEGDLVLDDLAALPAALGL